MWGCWLCCGYLLALLQDFHTSVTVNSIFLRQEDSDAFNWYLSILNATGIIYIHIYADMDLNAVWNKPVSTMTIPMAAASATATQQGHPSDDMPIFDFSRLKMCLDGKGDEGGTQSLVKEFADCCAEWGCFRLVNHGIDDELMDSVDKSCREVFSLPTEIKQRNGASSALYSYVGGVPEVPYYESLAVALDCESPCTFSQLMWPDSGNPKFCKVMDEYISGIKDVLSKLLEILTLALGVRHHHENFMENCKYQLRMNHYNEVAAVQSCLSSGSQKLGLGEHTDLGVLGLLLEDNVGGLEVLRNNRWIRTLPFHGSFVVFCGDLLRAWTNGRVHNPKHRVMVREGQKCRLSVGVFALIKDGIEIRAPTDLVQKQCGGIYKYKPFRYSEIASFKYGEGIGVEDPFNAFAALSIMPEEEQLCNHK